MAELLQYDGTQWRDMGPQTPDLAAPISARDSGNRWVQVSDLRPHSKDAIAILRAAHKYPVPRTGRSIESWMPQLFLAKRRIRYKSGRFEEDWFPGEQQARPMDPGDTRTGYVLDPHSSSHRSGVKFTQQLLDGFHELTDKMPKVRLWAKQGTHNYWTEWKIGAWNAATFTASAPHATREHANVFLRSHRADWEVTFPVGVSRMIAGRDCFLLIDGEDEYGPFVVTFKAPTPPGVNEVTVLRAHARSATSITLTWHKVTGATSYTITAQGSHSGHTYPKVTRINRPVDSYKGYVWGHLTAGRTYTFTVVANGPGWKSKPVSTHITPT